MFEIFSRKLHLNFQCSLKLIVFILLDSFSFSIYMCPHVFSPSPTPIPIVSQNKPTFFSIRAQSSLRYDFSPNPSITFRPVLSTLCKSSSIVQKSLRWTYILVLRKGYRISFYFKKKSKMKIEKIRYDIWGRRVKISLRTPSRVSNTPIIYSSEEKVHNFSKQVVL